MIDLLTCIRAWAVAVTAGLSMGVIASAMSGDCCAAAAGPFAFLPREALRGFVDSAGSCSPLSRVSPGPARLKGSSRHPSPMITCRNVCYGTFSKLLFLRVFMPRGARCVCRQAAGSCLRFYLCRACRIQGVPNQPTKGGAQRLYRPPHHVYQAMVHVLLLPLQLHSNPVGGKVHLQT